jgi:hypothetical protein
LIGTFVLWASATAAQDISPIDCLSSADQQSIALQFGQALKPYGLDDHKKLAQSIPTMMSDAIDKRAKADQCAEQPGGAAGGRCKAQEAAADEAEKRVEKLGDDMEKLQKDLATIRNRYRKC